MPIRQHQRLPVHQRVTVRFSDRGALTQAYLKDISRGGLFVATDQVFSLRDRVEVTLMVEQQGELPIEAEVVHIITAEQAAGWGGDAGVGVQFSNLDAERRDILESYLDGMIDRLGRELEVAEVDTRIIEAVETSARLGRLHDILGVDIRADGTEIEVATAVRLEALVALEQQTGNNPPVLRRVRDARAAVARAGQLLGDARRRAIYLFKTALVTPQELAEMVEKDLEARAEIETIWSQSFPEQASGSQRLAQLAISAAKQGDVKGARQSAKLALSQNPFLFELRDAMKTWD